MNCKEACIKLLQLDSDILEYFRDKRLTIEVFQYLYDKYKASFLFAFKRLGEKRSKLNRIIDVDTKDEITIYTYLGMHGEYIIIPEVSYCGCMSRYPSALEYRRICPHLIGFCIDCLLDEVEEVIIDDLRIPDAIELIYTSMFK